ncbi:MULTISPECIES: pectinesterase family protein [Clostridium]|uniref:pectinesterase family protein n=1 Tax=Clostridium TaxID=1485 RepID=UPI000824F229|nr:MULTISPECIES: pectinesterase family protein [Clostridium]PJI09573.1 pectinesterase A [Clostridium sp. CT7]
MKKKSFLSFVTLTCVTSLIPGMNASGKILSYNAIVDINFKGQDGTKVNGISTYKSITSAVSSAPTSSTNKYVIHIKKGTYYEKVTVNKPNITFIGEDRDKTKITYDVANSTKKPDGTTYGTFGSASLSVIAPNFSCENLTVENSFDYPSNKAKASNDPTKLPNPQAVALKLDENSEKAYIKNCKLDGYQDTLYCNKGTSYFTHCFIAGSIDFIFGAGQSFFNECEIISKDMDCKSCNGYIAAPSTLIENKYGFVFYKCNIKKGDKKMASNSVALARPWHPTTSFSDGTRKANPDAIGSAVYIDCYLDSHIKTTGWDKMHGKDKDKNLIWFLPEDSRFYEFNSKGPGADVNPSRRQLSENEAKSYEKKYVLNGWIPK